jgi:hypothetical protein
MIFHVNILNYFFTGAQGTRLVGIAKGREKEGARKETGKN